jgi:hypothetical protein
MSAKPLPKAVFEVGAISIVRINLATGKPFHEAAQAIWAGYARQVEDPSAVDDWMNAAEQLVAWLEKISPPAPAELMRHLQHFCQMFEDDGRPRKKRLFNGLMFSKNDYDTARVAKLIKKAQVYCTLAQGGFVPLAPESYR